MTPEQKNKRIAELEWSCMTPDEHARRIVELEELVIDMWPLTGSMPIAGCDEKRAAVRDRMRSLGVEIDK